MASYYNENNPHAAQHLRNLAAAGLIPGGHVDERSISDVWPDDLDGFDHVHFFAGIGGWAYAARLAGWPDDLPLWTGSPPCQPWSGAGEGNGFADERHLWPEMFRLIRRCRPAGVVGEQVERAAGRGWLDEVASDVEGIGYAFRPVVLPACSIGAPHRRDRIFFVAHGRSPRLSGAEQSERCEPCHQAEDQRQAVAKRDRGAPWRSYRQQRGADGIARLVEPGVRLLAHGIPARVDLLGSFGNAIVPQLGAEVLGAYLECLN